MSDAYRHIPHEDLAIYALQFLNGEESNAVALHVEQCPECRAELEAIRGDLAAYAMTAEMHSPPALTRQRLLKQVSREKKSIPVERGYAGDGLGAGQVSLSPRAFSSFDVDDPPRRNVAAVALPWIGWAIAAGVSFAAVNLYHQRDTMQHSMTAALTAQQAQIAHLTDDAAKARQVMDALTDNSAMRVTLTKAEAPATPIGRVTYLADKGMLLFLANNMEPLQTYKTYELWLIPADGRDSMPAGTFHPDAQGNASLIMDMPKGIVAKAFGVTIEDEGGSQTPTKPIIMVGM